ncbi:hypothetical protein Gogos_008365 [Gossypium gossypioides]|uniref:At1g61320/AtMIF1 LRR domain-containing protein n=1 Tax=Gossypium gossypioides TaxID=34282 RepID=A0A7J9CBZ2_GOSGO|nr:hypothetical protein [Gossypium gossypioides]
MLLIKSCRNLSIRDAVRISVMSKKWRHKWATIPYLVFDDQCLNTQGSNTQVHTFLSRLLGVTDTDRWILCISRSCIKDFILEIWKGQCYKSPSCLFNCQNLIHLELSNCSLKPPLTFKGFKNLRSLDLQHVTIIQDVFENLVSNCSLLERLALMNFIGVTRLDAPNLQFFGVG